MFDQHNNKIIFGEEPETLPKINGFGGTLMFICQKPYFCFEVMELDDGSTALIPRERTKYEFYIYRVNSSGEDVNYRLSIFQKVMQKKQKIYTKYSYSLQSIPKTIMSEEKENATHLGAGARIKIEMCEHLNMLGYSIVLDGAFVGFFSEYGDMKNCEPNAYGFVHIELSECPTLIKRSLTRIRPCTEEYERLASDYDKFVSKRFRSYIYNRFPLSGYAVAGVSDNAELLLIKSKQKDFTGHYKYYEIDKESFWLSKVKAKQIEGNDNYLTTFVNEYLGDLREFCTAHPLCGLSFELLKGVIVNQQGEIEKLFEATSIGGEIRKVKKIEKDS